MGKSHFFECASANGEGLVGPDGSPLGESGTFKSLCTTISVSFYYCYYCCYCNLINHNFYDFGHGARLLLFSVNIDCVGPSQVDSLSERVEELKQDKKRLVEEYEAKLSKVRPLVHKTLRNKKVLCRVGSYTPIHKPHPSLLILFAQ